MTPGQRLFRSAQALAGSVPLLNMGWRFDILGPIDPARFGAAFAEVVAARDALRLVLSSDGMRSGASYDVEICDLRADPDPLAAAEAEVAKRLAAMPDLAVRTWESALLQVADAHWIWVHVQHHCLTDARSGEALFAAVAAAYSGSPLPEATPFAETAQLPTDEASQRHWMTVPLDPPPPPPFGAQRRSDALRTCHHRRPFGADRVAALDDLITQTGFRAISRDLARLAVFATIFSTYLARANGAERQQIGVPVHARRTAADKAALGLMMETLPISVEATPGESFRTVHAKAMAAVLDWLRYAKPGVTTSRVASSYTAVLNYIPLSFGTFADHPTRVEWLSPGAQEASLDITMNILGFGAEADAGLALDLRLNERVFGEAALTVDQVFTLFDALLEDPDQPFDAVPLGGEMLTGRPNEPAPLLLERFDKHVVDTPDAIAAEAGDRQVTYAEFDALTRQYAAGVQAVGAGPGDVVLVHATRSVEAVAAIWGVLRAGAMFVPMATDQPDERVRAIVADQGIRFSIADARTAGISGCFEITPKPPTQPLPEISPDDSAYLILTSGTTGVPKGVEVQHQAFADFLDWSGRVKATGDFALCTALGFDLTLTVLFSPLIRGKRLVIYPEPAFGPDFAVLDAFREDRVDVIKLTPSHLALAVEKGICTSRLRTLLLGGEQLPVGLANAAAALGAPSLRILNSYGPAEAVVAVMNHVFDPEMDAGAAVSIGTPADGVTLAVMDAGGNPLPSGFAGELWISGRLSIGYRRRADLTEAAFPQRDGVRWYRTGDLARIGADGRLSFLGRIDTQLKLGGIRIEPEEIAAISLETEGVTAAHVGLRADATGRDRLVAWLVGTTPDIAALKARWRARLPRVMVPEAIVEVDALPLSKSGKILAEALPDPVVETAPTPRIAPQPGLENRLATWIASALGREEIGATENFYDLGGDSMIAVEISMTATANGVALEPTDLFLHPTVQALATAVSGRAGIPDARREKPALEPSLDLGAADMSALAAALKG